MIGGYQITDIAIFFIVYSVLGWITEVIYQAVSKGLVVNRGFLNGPVCPIYGFGALFVILLVNVLDLSHSTTTSDIEVFLLGVVLSTLLELIGGYVLLKVFHARWWDYSGKPLNYHGYICLEFSLIWGFGILFIVRRIHPLTQSLLGGFSMSTPGLIVLAIAYAGFASDLVVSVLIMLGLNKKIRKLDDMQQAMREFSDELSTRIGENALSTKEHVDEYKVQSALFEADVRDMATARREEVSHELAEMKQQYELVRQELYKNLSKTSLVGSGRILKSYPDLHSVKYPELVDKIKRNFKEYRK